MQTCYYTENVYNDVVIYYKNVAHSIDAKRLISCYHYYCDCIEDSHTLVVTNNFLSSFLLFHFPTKICIRFSSLKTSVIELKLEHNGLNSWLITF